MASSKVQANTSFRAGRVFVSANSWWNADDPIVSAYPGLFTSPDDQPVRTTATVSAPVASPPPTMQPETPVRPSVTAPKAAWARYVAELGGDATNATKSELLDLAASLEGG